MSDSQNRDVFLPESLLRALADASYDIGDRENWVSQSSPHRMSTKSYLMGFLLSYVNPQIYSRPIRNRVRALGLRILAFMPAEDRLGTLIILSQKDERVIQDLFSGEIPEHYEPYRHNIITSIAIFARYGLMREVFTHARIHDVETAIRRVQKAGSDDNSENQS